MISVYLRDIVAPGHVIPQSPSGHRSSQEWVLSTIFEAGIRCGYYQRHLMVWSYTQERWTRFSLSLLIEIFREMTGVEPQATWLAKTHKSLEWETRRRQLFLTHEDVAHPLAGSVARISFDEFSEGDYDAVMIRRDKQTFQKFVNSAASVILPGWPGFSVALVYDQKITELGWRQLKELSDKFPSVRVTLVTHDEVPDHLAHLFEM